MAITSTRSDSSEATHTPFRLTEKFFKNKKDHQYPCLRVRDDIVDLSRPARHEDDPVWQAGWWGSGEKPRRKGKERDRGERPAVKDRGLKAIETSQGKQAYIVGEGCVLIPGYIEPLDQLILLTKSLQEYTLPPNPLSLSTHYDLPPNLFELFANGSEQVIPPLIASPSHSRSSSPNHAGSARVTIDTDPDVKLTFEEIMVKSVGASVDAPSWKLKPKTAKLLMKELRWANLGWVYKWTSKTYDLAMERRIAFPRELSKTCAEVVTSIPWEQVFEESKAAPSDFGTWAQDYEPDTGIVNFYQMNDTLMGHVDRAELDPFSPLVSISLGHAAIFLLGTSSRQVTPRPIILRSGDVLIMAGDGRKCYHGIPRIMEGTLPAHFAADHRDDVTRAAAKRWIASGRVNINARQVFPTGFQPPQG